MRFLWLLLSLLGFFLLIRRAGRGRLHPAFVPAVSVSLISCIVLLGGIAGMLEQAERILFGVGITSFVFFGIREGWRISHRKADADRDDFAWMAVCFLALFIALALVTKNQFIYGYDDFTHWGLVARIMSSERRLPIAADHIGFSSYPLGSTAFIDYCCFVLGGKSDHYLFSLAIMTFSFLLSLQSCANRKLAGRIWTTLLAVALIFYEYALSTLLVDKLLGAALMAALLMYLYDRDHPKSVLPFLMPVLSAMVVIKNSGLPLALMVLGIVLIHMIRKQKQIDWSLFWAALPVMMYTVWKLHVQYTFTDYGKHQMSLYLYYANLRGNYRSVGQILQVILPCILSPFKNYALWLIPAFGLVYVQTAARDGPDTGHIVLMAAGIFLLYEAGMLIMYICSMGVWETVAQNGNDYDRYNSTMVIGLTGVLSYLIGHALPSACGERKKIICLALAAVFGGITLAEGFCIPPSLAENQEMYRDAYELSQIVEELPQQVNGEARYIIVSWEPNEDAYISHMAKYYLHSTNVSVYQETEAAQQEWEMYPESILINLREGTWQEANNKTE